MQRLMCERCGAALGFVPAELRFGAVDIQADGSLQRVDANAVPQRPCRNDALEQVCNWMVPSNSTDELCACCQTTEVIPALAKPENRAHWLAIQDGLETAAAWGLRLDQAKPGAPLVAPQPLAADASALEPVLVKQWLPVSQFINAMDRSLGSRDSYPFVLATPAIAKLEFLHQGVGAASRREVAMRFAGEQPPGGLAQVNEAADINGTRVSTGAR